MAAGCRPGLDAALHPTWESSSIRRDIHAEDPVRRFAAGACGRCAQTRRTARHPWRAANTNLPVRLPKLGAPLGSPPPEYLPPPRSTRRDAQGWGKRRHGAFPLATRVAVRSRVRVMRGQLWPRSRIHARWIRAQAGAAAPPPNRTRRGPRAGGCDGTDQPSSSGLPNTHPGTEQGAIAAEMGATPTVEEVLTRLPGLRQ